MPNVEPKSGLRALAGGGASPALAGKALLIAVAVTALLYVVPYGHLIGYPLVLVSTIAHEMGHGIAGVLVGGRFDSFVVFADASGSAHIVGYSGRFARAFVSAGGLCGPACAAGLGFLAARSPRLSRLAVVVAGAFLAVSLLWVVRNLVGWIAVGALAAGLLAVGLKARAELAQVVLVFLAVQLSLSVFSRGDYLFTDVANTAEGAFPSDVANMASALFLPFWMWGALCGAFSVAVLALGLRSYLKVVLGEPAPALAAVRPAR
jgi:hypothetical protein